MNIQFYSTLPKNINQAWTEPMPLILFRLFAKPKFPHDKFLWFNYPLSSYSCYEHDISSKTPWSHMTWKMLLSSIPQDTRILFLESESYKEGACVLTLEYEVHTVIFGWVCMRYCTCCKDLYCNFHLYKCVVTWDNWHIIELFLGTNILNPPV